jgi:Uma2 family endonuclease
MIAQTQRNPFLLPQEYLDWEAKQEDKYEYENGKIIAMTGGTIPHSQIPVNFAALLISHLRGKGCKIAISDAKVMTKSQKYYYPDLVVTCDERDRKAIDFLQYPCLIAEVLSPTTEARDRGIKQQHYMQMDTLQTYVLITPERPRVEIFQRGERSWEYLSIQIDGIDFAIADPTIHLARIDLSFPLSNLYENVDLEN